MHRYEHEYKRISGQNRTENQGFAEVPTYANFIRHENNDAKALFVNKTISLDDSEIVFRQTYKIAIRYQWE